MMNCCFVLCVLVATFFQIWSHFVPHIKTENGCGWWWPDDSKHTQGYSSVVPLLQTVGLVTEVLSVLLLLSRLCACDDDLDCTGSSEDCCSCSCIPQLLYKLSGISVAAKVCGCIFFICFLYTDYPELIGCCGLSFVSFLFSSFALCAWEGGREKILPQ